MLLALLTIWGIAFIWRSSFVDHGLRTFSLFDDAMISMTYARNLSEGYGLEWSRWAPPVEGFSHPLWLVPMVAVNATPLPLRWRSAVMQGVSLATLLGCVVICTALTRRHVLRDVDGPWLPAAALCAAYYPLLTWSLMGMETGLQALLVLLACTLTLDITERGVPRHEALFGVLALAFWLRMDMILLAAVCQGFLLVVCGPRAVLGDRGWRRGLALFLGSAAVLFTARGLYFHDLLPNTYYLKLTGVPLTVRLLTGLRSLTHFARLHVAALVLTGAAVLFAWRRDSRAQSLLLLVFATASGYAVWVGGDAWDHSAEVRANRFVAYAVPLLFPAWSVAAEQLVRSRSKILARLAVAAVTILGVAAFDGVLDPNAKLHAGQLALTVQPFGPGGNAAYVDRLRTCQRLIAAPAVVATVWAGIPAYFSDYRMVDLLGYNDRHIARLPSAVPFGPGSRRAFRPGHNKWDYRYVLEELRPDAFLQAWGLPPAAEAKLLHRHGFARVGEIWLRRSSPYLTDEARRRLAETHRARRQARRLASPRG